MDKIIFESDAEPVQVSAPVVRIRAAISPRELRPVTASPGPAYPRPYANEQMNSRIPADSPASPLSLRWKAPLREAMPPTFVLHDGSHILVQAGEWRLFDIEGRSIAEDRLGLGHAVLDSKRALLYLITPVGYVAARRLSDGSQPFLFLPAFGDGYSRVFLARHNQRMMIVGLERNRDPHGEHPPTKSVIQTVGLGRTPKADDMGYLSTLECPGYLLVPSPELLAAGVDDTLIAAVPGRIFIVDWDMKVHRELEGGFQPRALSLDESGRIYLTVETEARNSLWLLSQEGERAFAFDFPPGASSNHPPIVAYDHTVFLLSGSHIFSVATDGKLRWSRAAAGAIGGAVVTAGNELLVSEGSDVAVYDAKGKRRVLWSVPGEQLLTPPVATADGDVLVASGKSLFRLGAKR